MSPQTVLGCAAIKNMQSVAGVLEFDDFRLAWGEMRQCAGPKRRVCGFVERRGKKSFVEGVEEKASMMGTRGS